MRQLKHGQRAARVSAFFHVSSVAIDVVLGSQILIGLLALFVAKSAEARRVPKAKVKSLWLHKGPVRVWQKPRYGSPIRGEIQKCGRFRTLRVLDPGGGCSHRWYQIGSEAFVCSGWSHGSSKPPSTLPDLTGRRLPGHWVVNRGPRTLFYPRLKALSKGTPQKLRVLVGFRVVGSRMLGRRAYLHTADGGWVAPNQVRSAPSTTLVGVTLSKKGDLPLAFVIKPTRFMRFMRLRHHGSVRRHTGGSVPRHTRGSLRPIPTQHKIKPYATWKVMRRIAAGNSCFLQIRALRFIPCEAARFASSPPPPPSLVGPKEHWIDIDGQNRILYARRGRSVERVILVTLSSKTPGGIFRVEHKHVSMTLYNHRHKTPWHLEQVPHVIFFYKGFALHGAYWHNSFGTGSSHGCVNMSPTDAEWIFRFTSPNLPRGFSRIDATPKDKGTLIRIRGQRRTVRTKWTVKESRRASR